MDQTVSGCLGTYSGTRSRFGRRRLAALPCESALAFGSDYDLERDDALWPRPGLAPQSER